MIPEFSDEVFLTCKDHGVSGECFQLVKNGQLDLLKTTPQPEPEKLPLYYESKDYISHSDASGSLMEKTYQVVKGRMIRKKLNWISKHKKRGCMLDIGAGTGDFLLGAQKSGWRTSGIEPNISARKLACDKGVQVVSQVSDLNQRGFDVITLWHVLEHVYDIEKQILQIQHLLKDNGLLVIAVPNYRSHDAEKYREFWAGYDVPRHLYHFSPTALEKIMGAFSFSLVDKKPLKYDAYYVSLLSEQYLTGRKNILRALSTGLLSNLKAIRTGQYSSLAYFFQNSRNNVF